LGRMRGIIAQFVGHDCLFFAEGYEGLALLWVRGAKWFWLKSGVCLALVGG